MFGLDKLFRRDQPKTKTTMTEAESDQEVQETNEAVTDTGADQEEEISGSVEPPCAPSESKVETPSADRLPLAEEPCIGEILTKLESLNDASVQIGNNQKTLYENMLDLQRDLQHRVTDISQELKRLSSLEEHVSALQEKVKEFEGTLKFTSGFVERTETEHVRVLREENERLKEGITQKLERKLLDEVIGEIDSAEATVKRLVGKENDELTAESVLQELQSIVSDFRTMLDYRFGLIAYWTNERQETDDDKHRIASLKEITEDSDLDGKIARTVRCGYMDKKGIVYRKETVIVYEHKVRASPDVDPLVTDDSTTAFEQGTELDVEQKQEIETQDLLN